MIQADKILTTANIVIIVIVVIENTGSGDGLVLFSYNLYKPYPQPLQYWVPAIVQSVKVTLPSSL